MPRETYEVTDLLYGNELYLVASLDIKEDAMRYEICDEDTLKQRLKHRIEALRVYEISIDDYKLKMEIVSKERLKTLEASILE